MNVADVLIIQSSSRGPKKFIFGPFHFSLTRVPLVYWPVRITTLIRLYAQPSLVSQ